MADPAAQGNGSRGVEWRIYSSRLPWIRVCSCRGTKNFKASSLERRVVVMAEVAAVAVVVA